MPWAGPRSPTESNCIDGSGRTNGRPDPGTTCTANCSRRSRVMPYERNCHCEPSAASITVSASSDRGSPSSPSKYWVRTSRPSFTPVVAIHVTTGFGGPSSACCSSTSPASRPGAVRVYQTSAPSIAVVAVVATGTVGSAVASSVVSVSRCVNAKTAPPASRIVAAAMPRPTPGHAAVGPQWDDVEVVVGTRCHLVEGRAQSRDHVVVGEVVHVGHSEISCFSAARPRCTARAHWSVRSRVLRRSARRSSRPRIAT